MKKIIFAKFSKERNKKFQIITSITDEPKVIKRAVSEQSQEHLQHIADYYDKFDDTDSPIKLCPCRLNQDGSLEFDFISGESLEEIIFNHISAHDTGALYKDIELLKSIINNQKNLKAFHITQEFRQVFGDMKLDCELSATQVTNIDLITSNIMVNENIYIIDYEWIFDFPIPIEFVMFRALFSNGSINNLPEEIKDRVYDIAGVPQSLIPVFTDMERRFQKYVTEEKLLLSVQHRNMGNRCIPIDNINVSEVSTYMRAYAKKGEESAMIFDQLINGSSIDAEIDVDDQESEAIIIDLLNVNGIIKINELTAVTAAGDEVVPEYNHNAELVIHDDYFFRVAPSIQLINKNYVKVKIKYLIYYMNTNLINDNIDYIWKENKLEGRISQLEQEKEQLLSEINRIKSGKLWNIYNKFL